LSDVWTIEELRRATSVAVEQYKCLEEKRILLEKKTKILEEKAHMEKLVVDKNLLVQILEEEKRTHDDTVKELEDKIASLEQQIKPSLSIEGSPTPTSSESAQEISNNIDKDVNVDVPLQPEESTVQEFQEGTKKKKRSFF
jgi:CRISPR/Cas system CMR subunit Cmr6 (Cas7 group RAMP superfamily)